MPSFKYSTILFLYSCYVFSAHSVSALEFSSQREAATVVELYTSEGCSSCPPAERWLSDFKHDKSVFKNVIPLAFHVDYWDGLGWKDRFAQKSFSERQYALATKGILSSVYTPGIIVSSQEWRPWFKGERDVPINTDTPGVLHAEIKDNALVVKFEKNDDFILNVAYLGMGLSTEVTTGENRQRTLQHDFVVLKHWMTPASRLSWQTQLLELPEKGQKKTAIVVWLSKPDSMDIVQAAASFLN